MLLISHEMRRIESEAAETDAQVQRLRREVAGARQECDRLEQVCMAKAIYRSAAENIWWSDSRHLCGMSVGDYSSNGVVSMGADVSLRQAEY